MGCLAPACDEVAFIREGAQRGRFGGVGGHGGGGPIQDLKWNGFKFEKRMTISCAPTLVYLSYDGTIPTIPYLPNILFYHTFSQNFNDSAGQTSSFL